MSLRQERINKVLLHEISEILLRMRDPRLGFLTITNAKVSADLQVAQIGVSVFAEPEGRQRALAVLQAASGYVRSQLGKGAHLKTVPALEFYLDESALHSVKVQQILKDITDEQPGD